MRREHGSGRIGLHFDDEHAILRYLPLTFIVHCTILDMSKPGRSCPATYEAASPEAPKWRCSMNSQTVTQPKQRFIDMQSALAFQTVALKAVTALADEASDHAKEWAEQSAAFLGQVFAAKTPVKAAEIQIAYSRHAVESLVARGKKLSELYASAINEARRPLAA